MRLRAGMGMAKDNESIGTKAERRAMKLFNLVVERVQAEFEAGVGFEKVSERKTTDLIDEALRGGDMTELRRLANINGCQMAPNCPCPVCQKVNERVKELTNAR